MTMTPVCLRLCDELYFYNKQTYKTLETKKPQGDKLGEVYDLMSNQYRLKFCM